MSENEITEGNKLIAKFMGLTPNPHDNCKTWAVETEIIDGQIYGDNWINLFYNSSWDYLMPVLNKISNEVEISDKYAEAYYSYYHIDSNLMWLPIQEVFENVVCILKWYCK